MKKSQILALALVLTGASMMSSCATTHLWRWGTGEKSFIDEPQSDFSASVLKPSLTFLFTPVTAVWDIATLPMQLVFQVYPYFGQKHMAPAEVGD